MGTISKVLGQPLVSDSDELKELYRMKVAETLQNGYAEVIPGLKIPLGLEDFPAPVRQMAADDLLSENTEDFDEMWGNFYVTMMDTVDTAIPEGKNTWAIGVMDPTFPILPIITLIEIEILIPLGLDLSWLVINLPKIIDLGLPFLDAIKDLAVCETEKMEEIFKEIDPDQDWSELRDKLEAICPLDLSFELPDIPWPPEIPIPTFSWPWSFPPPLGFTIPWLGFPDWPNLNWSFLTFFDIVIQAIGEFILKIPELILKIVDGIAAFIEACIMLLVNLIIDLLKKLLEPLLSFITFAAAILTLIGLIVPAIIVAVIGFCMGAGLIANGAAIFMGLK